jgi:inorganic triphosphatase YgiF
MLEYERGMGRDGFELELKFSGAPADIAALPDARVLHAVAAGPGGWARLESAYFDTADGALGLQGISLRVRDRGGRRIQTVKQSTAAGAVVREEYETEIVSGDAFPMLTGEAFIDEMLQSARGRLQQIAEIAIDRWTQPARYEGSRFEIAVDHGAARAGGAATPIAQLEIEFEDGQMAHLFDLARLIAENAALRLTTRTKLETAQALADGGLYRLDKLKKPSLDPDAPAADALQAMLAAVAIRVIDVQGPLVDLRAPVGVHQMRVALRRFRAVERTFRKALDTDALYLLTRRARTIAQALGPARDLDVFLDETAPEVFSRPGAPEGAAAMRSKAEAMRAAAWAQAHKTVADKSFTQFALDLLEAGVAAPWRAGLNDLGHAPLRDFAPKALDRAFRRSRRAEAEMDRTVLAARHPLRIALKKQRYAAQMLGPIFDKERRRPYMAALSRLQAALGVVNDAVVAQVLAEEISAGEGDAAMRACGFLSGYKAAEAEAAAAEIDQAWEIFEKTEPFWRDPPPDEE